MSISGYILTNILSDILSDMLSDILSDTLSNMMDEWMARGLRCFDREARTDDRRRERKLKASEGLAGSTPPRVE